jgi:hypothetical protein
VLDVLFRWLDADAGRFSWWLWDKYIAIFYLKKEELFNSKIVKIFHQIH